MNSFDVFDTLIARRFITSDAILMQIERDANLPGFAVSRKAADTGQRSFDQIYQFLVTSGILTTEQAAEIKQREITLEIATAVPIQVNMDKVQHGDLLISDMYLPSHIILQLVRAAGLDKQVTIFQSNADKHTGAVWEKLAGNHTGFHLGDNLRSDVEMPNAVGIKGVLCKEHSVTQVEEFCFNNKISSLGFMLREIRLRQKQINVIFDIALSLNLPWLFLASEMLHRKYKDKDIVFLGRDCQLLQRIYSTYYKPSSYLPFSRQVAYSQPKDAVEYLTVNASDNSVFIDIISTGGTWEKINQYGKVNITVLVYSDLGHNSKVKPVLPDTFDFLVSHSMLTNANILYPEFFNCGDHGHLDSVTKLADGIFASNFAELDLSESLTESIHGPVAEAVALEPYYLQNIRTDLANLSDGTLVSLYKTFLEHIGRQHDLRHIVPEFFAKEDVHLTKIKEVMYATPSHEAKLTELANRFMSDKGTTYKCAHGYTEHYAKLFAPYVDKPVMLLEIGLNRDNQDSIPSMSIYEQFFSNATLYGLDIHPGFMKFNNPPTRTIIIGDQSDPAALGQLGGTQFDIIIDDGYHASKHQQITLRELWKNLKSGGAFVLEDLHYQPDPSIETSVLTKNLMREWAKGNPATSDWMPLQSAKSILSGVARIEMFDSKSTNWSADAVKHAFVVLHKK